MLRSHFNRSGAYIIGADGTVLGSRCQRWCFAVFGGTGFRAYPALQAESLGCDSLGWSAQRAAPGSVVRKIPPPCKGGTIQACADGGLTGLGYIFGDVHLGLRSQTRFSPGFHIAGLQPSGKVSCQNHADAIIPRRHFIENNQEPQRSSYPYGGAGVLGIDLGRRHAVPPVGGFVAAVLPGGSGYF